MKVLNAAVAGLVVITLAISLRREVEPPADPWFQKAVVQSQRPVLVKFGAEWCPPCRHMESVLDEVQSAEGTRVRILRIDIDEKPELAAHYGIRSIPRLLLFDHGRLIATHGGFADANATREWIAHSLP